MENIADLNKDGKIDEFEQKQFKLFGGRSFFLSVIGMLFLCVLQFFGKIDNVAYPIAMIIGLYLGRSSVEDFSPKENRFGGRH